MKAVIKATTRISHRCNWGRSCRSVTQLSESSRVRLHTYRVPTYVDGHLSAWNFVSEIKGDEDVNVGFFPSFKVLLAGSVRHLSMLILSIQLLAICRSGVNHVL